jgi:TonB family protein
MLVATMWLETIDDRALVPQPGLFRAQRLDYPEHGTRDDSVRPHHGTTQTETICRQAIARHSTGAMMRLWMLSYMRQPPVASAGALSVAVHGALILSAVVGTRPPTSMAENSLANRIFYIPPPNRPPTPPGGHATVHYITLAQGLGAGPGPSTMDARRPISIPEQSREAGNARVDSATTPAATGDANADSVFTMLEVDSVVVRSASSAAPAYPLDLLEKHIEGFVVARYTVDTTGFADVASLQVLKATNPGFEQSVRDALPYMRFSPAKIGAQKVRQLVEQTFTFRIAQPAVSGVAKPR